MTKTLMDPHKQAILEELEFKFREIQGQQTKLDTRAEEIIYNKLAEADVAISELEGITEDDILIAHAMIYVINGSLSALYANVVEDISNRIKRFMSGEKPTQDTPA